MQRVTLRDATYRLRKVRQGMARLEELLEQWVPEAKRAGATWAQIGAALGLTREETMARYGPRRASHPSRRASEAAGEGVVEKP